MTYGVQSFCHKGESRKAAEMLTISEDAWLGKKPPCCFWCGQLIRFDTISEGKYRFAMLADKPYVVFEHECSKAPNPSVEIWNPLAVFK